MKLYSYQENAIEAILSDPSHSQLISMPTGTGKTITFLNAAKQLNKKCLILVHREELLNQTYDKARLCGFEENDISIICAGKKEHLSHLNIAMVQTLSRNLTRYKAEEIEMMIVDEAHHSTADSYRKIFDHFQIFEKRKTLLGFTATPLRGDNACLSSIYESHSFKMTLSEATQNGYICPVHGMRVIIDKELQEIENTGGDYKIDDLDKVMNCEAINQVVVERCQHLEKVPALIFCTSVDHAQKLAALLREKNRSAECVSYKTDKQELKIILDNLKSGKIEFITNAVKLSEGFDYPPIQSIISVRPTRSPVLYKQIIGRGLRKSEGKYDCFVLEFCGNDPKMINWEDIDNNSTFQSFTESQKKSREEALSFYHNRFTSPNVRILDVRISPFQFYECKIRRVVKFKHFFYLPHDWGFTVFQLKKSYGPGKGADRESGFNLWCDEVFWKEKYMNFYIWGESDYLWYQPHGWYSPMIPKLISNYASKQADGQMGRWYPSEEESVSGIQKKFLKSSLKLSARKTEMYIEDSAIKQALQKYWIDNAMKDQGCGNEFDTEKISVNCYHLVGKY